MSNVSSASTFELTRDQLLRRAFQVAGLMYSGAQTNGDDLSMASDLLGIELDSLQAEGVILRTIEPDTIPLVASTAEYTLDSDTLDVYVGPNSQCGTVYTSSGAEIPVLSTMGHDYNLISDKDEEGTPSLVYIKRQATVSVAFWQVPAESMTFRFQKIRLRRDMGDGTNTLDLGKRWQKAILYAMAWQLASAKSKPLEVVRDLRSVAEGAKKAAQLGEVESPHAQLYIPSWWH